MIKYLFIILLFTLTYTFSKTADSLFADTLVVKDTIQTAITDSSSANDTIKTLQKIESPDTLVPINFNMFSGNSEIISKKTFLYTPYRYTGDLLKPFSLSFKADQGFIGQPHEIFIYGVGNRGISYLEDGVLWNDRLSNSLDLNLIQSEDIDSIEIIPSPRGFLYGPYNNPVAVNFIMQDFLSPDPYTRIKYYEGPNGEAMIDGKFNAKVAKRWNLSLQITNRSVDETYNNTDLSIWQANVKLKYLLSNAVNISALYSYVNSSIGLNGGIDIDSLQSITSNVNSIIYEPLIAPVVYPNRVKDLLQHNTGLRLLLLPFKNAKLNLSFYYRYFDSKLTDAVDTIDLYENYENKILGSMLKYDHKIDIVEVKLLGTYEKLNTDYIARIIPASERIEYNNDIKRVSFTSVLSLNLFNDKLVPSFFYRYLDANNKDSWQSNNSAFSYNKSDNFSGFGGDITFRIEDKLLIYFGYSRHKQFSDSADVETIELGLKYKYDGFFATATYFKRNNFYLTQPYNLVLFDPVYPLYGNTEGVGANINYQFWKILFETNTSYYFTDEKNEVIGVPELQFIGGLYLKSKFFDDNLSLKSGFAFYYTDKRNSYNLEWGFVEVEPSNKLDFILIGEIQERAIVYFVWENLFDKQYFITPYYPMPERSIRFGLSWELFN